MSYLAKSGQKDVLGLLPQKPKKDQTEDENRYLVNTQFLEFEQIGSEDYITGVSYPSNKKSVNRYFLSKLTYDELLRFIHYLKEFHKVGSFEAVYCYLAEAMARKLTSINETSLFHSSAASIVGTLMYNMEGYLITRYKVGRVFLYYLQNTEDGKGAEVNEDQCIDYIRIFLKRFLGVKHLP